MKFMYTNIFICIHLKYEYIAPCHGYYIKTQKKKIIQIFLFNIFKFYYLFLFKLIQVKQYPKRHVQLSQQQGRQQNCHQRFQQLHRAHRP